MYRFGSSIVALAVLATVSADYVSGSCPGIVTYCAEVCETFSMYSSQCEAHMYPQFDNLNGSSSIPDGYDGMLWNGWTAVDPLEQYLIQAPNGPGALAIQAPSPEGSSLSIEGGIGEVFSFYFACSGILRGTLDERLPEPCSIQVVVATDFFSYSFSSYGPFASTVDFTALQNRVPAEMTLVTVNATASRFYVYVTEGSSSSTLLLANPYYERQC